MAKSRSQCKCITRMILSIAKKMSAFDTFCFFCCSIVRWRGIGNLNIYTAGTCVKYRARSKEEKREEQMPHMIVNLFKFYNESVLLLLLLFNRVFFESIVLFLLFFVCRESCFFVCCLFNIVILR